MMEQVKIELLVLEASQGDERAFSQLCRYFHPSLVRFAFKLSGNEQLAHDSVQNAWLKVTKSIKRIQDPRAFKSWVFQAVRWQTLDLMKKNRKDETWLTTTDINTLPDENIKGKNEDLLYYISKLPAIDQQAIHLFYLEQMRLQEISIILKIPVGTVKSRLNRARQVLKKQLIKE